MKRYETGAAWELDDGARTSSNKGLLESASCSGHLELARSFSFSTINSTIKQNKRPLPQLQGRA